MDFHLAFLIVVTVGNFFLGIMVWHRDRKNIVNRLFGLTILSAIAWSIFNYLCDLQAQAYNALFWNKLTLIFGIIFASLFAYFGLVFPRTDRFAILLKPPFLIAITSFIIFLCYLTLFSTLILWQIEFYEWGTNIVSGKLFFLLSAYCIYCVAIGLWSLISKYKKSKGIEKKQVQFLLLGIMLSAAGILTTNLIQPLITGSNPYAKYGPYFTTFLIIFTTYGITKHHLMNLKIVATELLVGMMTIILLVDTLLSKSLLTGLIKLLILVAFSYLGISLIRSVLQEIKRREEIEGMSFKLQKAYQELQKLDVAKTEFVSIASHQLRTPLTVIKGFISMLLEGTYGKLPQKTIRPMENVYKSNERLIKLVNNMLTISKVEMGKLEPEFEKADINEIISELVQGFKIQTDEKGLYLKWQKPKKKLPKLVIDKDKIRQTISNLLDNAIHYTEKGEIIIKVQGLGSKVQVMISDTGAGMGKEEASKLFQSFARGSAGTRLWVEGAGLGLYIAKKYIDLHKGKIWVESKGKGKGSTFFIELPIKK